MVQYYGKVATLEERWNDIKPYAKVLLKKTDEVLDIGCAEGLLTNEIAKLVPEGWVYGIEKNPDYSSISNKQQNIIINYGDILTEKLDFTDYDAIFCLGVFHKLDSMGQKNLLERIFESKARVIFLRSPHLETRFTINAWGCGYSIFSKESSYKGQGPIYICQKLDV